MKIFTSTAIFLFYFHISYSSQILKTYELIISADEPSQAKQNGNYYQNNSKDSIYLINLLLKADILQETNKDSSFLIYENVCQEAKNNGMKTIQVLSLLKKAEALLYIDKYNEANDNLDIAIKILKINNNDSLILIALVYKMEVFTYLGEKDSAILYYREGMSYKEFSMLFKGKLIYGMAQIHFDNFETDSAMFFFKQAYEIFLAIKDTSQFLITDIKIAELEMSEGKIDTAQKHFEKIKFFIESNNYCDNNITSNFYLILGDLNKKLGKLEEATFNYDKAMQHFSSSKDYYGEALCMQRIGNILIDKGNYVDAEVHLKNLVEKCVLNNLNILLPRIYVSLISVYSRQKNFEAAIKAGNLGILAAKNAGDIPAINAIRNNQATAYSREGYIDSAIILYKSIINSTDSNERFEAKYYPWFNLSWEYFKNKEYYRSDSIGTLVYSMALKSKQVKEKMSSTYLLYNIKKELQDYQAALNFYELNRFLRDSVVKSENLNAIESLNIKYQTAEKEKQILKLNFNNEISNKNSNFNFLKFQNEKILRENTELENDSLHYSLLIQIQEINIKEKENEIIKKNEEQAKLDVELQTQIAYNERLLKEQKSRNNKLILSGFLLFTFISFKIYKGRDYKIKLQLKELELKSYQVQVNPHSLTNMLEVLQIDIISDPIRAQKYCKNLASLQEDITKYADPKCKEITLKQELETLEKYILIQQERFNQNFSFTIQINSGIDTSFIKVPPLLLRPLVENAIEHGVRNLNYKGQILITINKVKDGYVYSIKDNGIGYTKSLEQQKTLKPAFGLQNTKERIENICKQNKLKNDFSIQSIYPGTLIKFILPTL